MKKYFLIILVLLIIVTIFTYLSSKDNPTYEESFENLVNSKDVPPEILASLPPDPGLEGKSTLEGIDSDNDGVRDDVQRYIAIEYWESPTLQLALHQYSKAHLEAITVSDNKSRANQVASKIERSLECLDAVAKDGLDASGELVGVINNTPSRSRAYIEYDSHLGGRVVRIPSISSLEACDFEVSSEITSSSGLTF